MAWEALNNIACNDEPTVPRFPKGRAPSDIPSQGVHHGLDVLLRRGEQDVLVVSIGAMAGTCLDVAERLLDHGIGVTVVDPRWLIPVSPALVELAAQHQLVGKVEDGGRAGGIGSAIAQANEHAEQAP